MSQQPEVTSFFDPATHTFSYIVKDPASDCCAIIDSVLDFDYAAGRVGHRSADRIAEVIQKHKLKVEWLLETHVHADHLSAASYLKGLVGGRIAIGSAIREVQKTFGAVFNGAGPVRADGFPFDRLFDDQETFRIGKLEASVLHTSGHTPACSAYVIGNSAFVGDTLFMPDGGTARADFPGGNARQLYRSIKKILALSPDTKLFMCHDYGPNGRRYQFETTVGAQRTSNIHVHDAIGEDEFVALRIARDSTLPMPQLIIPALQINIKAGEFPEPEPNGCRYLKVPLDRL